MERDERLRAELLLIEDEPGLTLALTDRLAAEGYGVTALGDGEAGELAARERDFDLVLLDVMLPRRSGFDVCRNLRRQGIETLILMLTARGEPLDKVLGLKLGADDYLAKPFDMGELLARIEALLRRARRVPEGDQGSYTFGAVRVDFRRAEVRRDGEPVEISALEYKLLRFFLEHRGRLLSREELLDKVWGYDRTVLSRTVDQHVATLRRKLEPIPAHPRHILTVHGLGYRFVG